MIAIRQLPQRKHYLTFTLGNGEYGFDVLRVEGIYPLRYQPINPIPGAPQYCRGFATMQGKATAVFSTKVKLGMPESRDTLWTAIVLTTLAENIHVGWIVDRACDVIDVYSPEIKMTHPDHGGVVLGLVERGMRSTTLLDAVALLESPHVIAG